MLLRSILGITRTSMRCMKQVAVSYLTRNYIQGEIFLFKIDYVRQYDVNLILVKIQLTLHGQLTLFEDTP